jgi:hypothetical protein
MTTPIRPGRPCSICTDSRRKQIDKAILSGVPMARIVRENPGIGLDSLYRHSKRHIKPAQLVRAAERADEDQDAHVTSLALDARRLRAKAISLLLKAESAGDLNAALRGIKEAAGCLLLEARILGEVDNGPPVSVSVESQPQVVVVLPSNGRESPEIIGSASDFPAIEGSV